MNGITTFPPIAPEITSYFGLRKIYFPETYNAVGDGVTDDTNAFSRIPSGAKIIFLKPGATYLVSEELTCFSANTKIIGNFATIKRSNAVKTELAAAAAESATSITVVDSTGFLVGDYFTITNNDAATYAGKGDQENSNRGGDLITISSIVGNTITFNNASLSGLQLPENGELDGAGEYPIGSNVIRTFNIWGLGNANDNIEIENLIIDGNVTGNDWTYDWRVNNTGALKGQNIKIKGCHFKNTPSENITVSGEVWFDKCYVENLTGGICHISTSDPTTGTNGYWITNCKGKNVGQHSAEAGHSNSFVTYSASGQEVWILNNDIENDLSGGSKINTGHVFGPLGFTTGSGDDYSDGNTYVRGNRFTNFEDIANIFSNTADANQNVKNIHIEENDFINCGDLLVRGNAITDGGGVRDIFFNRNTVTNGRIFFEEVYGLEVIGNKLKQEEDYSFADSIIGLSNVNTVGHIYIKASNVKIKDNKVIGKTTNDDYCKRGIFATSNTKSKNSAGTDTDYGYYQDVSIEGNTVRNHHEQEISTSADAVSTARSVERVGWSVKNNHVYAQKDSTSENLMWVDPGVTCYGNKVYTYLSGQVGIRAFGINSSGPITTCKGAIVRNNEVYGPATTPIATQANNNDYNSIITGNIIQVELADSGAGKSMIFDNILLLSTMGTPNIINEDEDSDEY